jgi:hypothetical protein
MPPSSCARRAAAAGSPTHSAATPRRDTRCFLLSRKGSS